MITFNVTLEDCPIVFSFSTYTEARAEALRVQGTARIRIWSGNVAILGDETYRAGTLTYRSAGFLSFT